MLREIGGTNCELRYTVNSMCAVEARVGGPLEDILKYDFAAVRLLLWGGLIEGCQELTRRAAGERRAQLLEHQQQHP